MKSKSVFPRMQIFKEITEITSEIPVETIMAKDLKTLSQDNSVYDAVEMMAKNSLSSVIVVNTKKEPLGIVSTGDLVKKVFFPEKNPRKIKIREIMSKGVETISPKMTIGEASAFMDSRHIRRLPVVDPDSRLLGMVTSTDLVHETNKIYNENRKLLWNTGLINFLFIMGGMIIVLLVANLVIK